MKVSVIGTGYVGLVTGTCLAESGNDVICMDVDAKKIGMSTPGKYRFTSQDLRNLLSAMLPPDD